ncbi:MAG: hypothetical protein KatS3mg076_1361 [Candidatus Binatia bacterium]|nr:MAG: hypothetical protein KatS3mg076_1361 [Candidatus Binatia bacterium]
MKAAERKLVGKSNDDERLAYVGGGKKPDLDAPLFGPGSPTWRVNREATLLLAGGRALLLQVAHPLVAAAVAEHSSFRTRPLERLFRTLDLTLTVVFRPAREALAAVRKIERVHDQVHGVLREEVGVFPRGTPYDANDPELLFWVHATLVDSALLGYEKFVGRLRTDEKAEFYEESKVVARLFGIPPRWIPRDWRAFRDYWAERIEGPVLEVGKDAREIAHALFSPRLPPGLRHFLGFVQRATLDLLPEEILDRFGFVRPRLTISRLAPLVRGTLPLWPGFLRYFPHARRAGVGR